RALSGAFSGGPANASSRLGRSCCTGRHAERCTRPRRQGGQAAPRPRVRHRSRWRGRRDRRRRRDRARPSSQALSAVRLPSPSDGQTPLTDTELLPGWQESKSQHHARSALRWGIPAVLLPTESPTLSFLVHLPTAGPAIRFVHAVRLAIPVILGSFAAGWMLRRGVPDRADLGPLPPWRPWPAAALQPVAFAVTALLAWTAFRPGAPLPSTPAVALVLASAAVTACIALWISAPAAWLPWGVFRRWACRRLAVAVGALSWRAAAGAEALWGVLSDISLRGAAILLRLISANVTVGPDPDLIEVNDFAVVVTPVCSG